MFSQGLTRRFAAILAVSLSVPSLAQVQARQATPEDERARASAVGERVREEVASPLYLEVPLRTEGGTSVLQLFKIGSGVWSTDETDAFVCDRAHVSQVEVRSTRARRGAYALSVGATFKSGWFRQDIDVTIQLLAPDGSVIAARTWDNETIGNDAPVIAAGFTKTLRVDAKVSSADLDRWAAEAEPAKVTIHMAIQ